MLIFFAITVICCYGLTVFHRNNYIFFLESMVKHFVLQTQTVKSTVLAVLQTSLHYSVIKTMAIFFKQCLNVLFTKNNQGNDNIGAKYKTPLLNF